LIENRISHNNRGCHMHLPSLLLLILILHGNRRLVKETASHFIRLLPLVRHHSVRLPNNLSCDQEDFCENNINDIQATTPKTEG